MAIQEDLRSIAPDDPSGLRDQQFDGTDEATPRMRVRKRDGSLDAIDLNKIVTRVERFDAAIAPERNWNYEFFGLRTVYDRYLLRHPIERKVIENPQYFLMRVACGLATTPDEAVEFYRLISSLEYLPSSPTLFNSGTAHPQMSSCYLLDSPRRQPRRHLRPLQGRRPPVQACGWHRSPSFSRIRSRGSLIRGTNGLSNGIVPWLKTLDARSPRSTRAAAQGCRVRLPRDLARRHRGVLELRDNTGDAARRAHNLNLANWVPTCSWSGWRRTGSGRCSTPRSCPNWSTCTARTSAPPTLEAESAGLYVRQVSARELYAA
jgi:ribonucleoside-diphosphate reductase alpha chain